MCPKRRKFGTIARTKSGRGYTVRYWQGSHKRSQYAGPTKHHAELLLARIESELYKGRALGIEDCLPIRFDDFAKEYLRMIGHSHAETTVNRTLPRVEALSDRFGGMYVHNVSLIDVRRYVAACYQKGNKHGTVNRKLSLLSAMFRTAIELGYARENPVKRIRREREGRREFRYIEPRDQQKLVDAAGPIRLFVVLALDTGMRPSELFRLRWSNVDLDCAVITIQETKTRVGRSVPLTERAIGALTDRVKHGRRQDGYILPWRALHGAVYQGWEEMIERAGLEVRVTPYYLRHLFATNLAMAGESLPNIAQLLGCTVTTAARYVDHVRKDILTIAKKRLDAMTSERRWSEHGQKRSQQRKSS